MESAQLEILHEHYRDSCTVMQGQRAARDRYFYMVIAVVAIAWFDIVAPQDFAAIVGEALKTNLQLPIAPDLGYLRSILWFLLLGLTVRYCQTALSLERHYDYIHDIEALLSKHVHEAFGREGTAYLSKYPLFLMWAHYLYVVACPLLLLGVVATWTRAQIPNWRPASWPGLVWFDCLVSLAIVVSVVLYWAFQVRKKDPGESDQPAAGPRRRAARRR
ncbi:MAG TPA: hypothetical protein VJM31_19400 [Vicinamibacterales bacterium]|nr:hypothetical protein [Vicinamibacterales bacterium]